MGKIRYYTYAAIIIILAGIYMFNLPHIVGTGYMESYTAKRYFPYVLEILACFVETVKIAKGTGNALIKYDKLTEEEKKRYNTSKVKAAQILYILSLTILIVFQFVSSEIYSDVIPHTVFTVWYAAEVAILFIFAKTKLILNWFCRKKQIEQV